MIWWFYRQSECWLTDWQSSGLHHLLSPPALILSSVYVVSSCVVSITQRCHHPPCFVHKMVKNGRIYVILHMDLITLHLLHFSNGSIFLGQGGHVFGAVCLTVCGFMQKRKKKKRLLHGPEGSPNHSGGSVKKCKKMLFCLVVGRKLFFSWVWSLKCQFGMCGKSYDDFFF